MADTSLLLEETTIWKLVEFAQAASTDCATFDPDTGDAGTTSIDTQPPDINPDSPEAYPTAGTYPMRRCYFGLLELEIGDVSLSVMTVGKNGLAKELRKLKEQYNVKLVSFENALIALPSFRQMHYDESMHFLVESLSKFYACELMVMEVVDFGR